MQAYVARQEQGSPEYFVGRVARQLRNHVLWDSLLIFSPPLLAALYLLVVLYRGSWLPALPVLLLASAAMVFALLGIIVRFRPRVPSLPAAARLVDDHVQAKDRFITLATLDSSASSEAMLARLRREARELLNRVETRRDFPYSLKRSFYRSISCSAVVIVLFHLLLNTAVPKPGVSPQQQIRELAEEMARRPPLAEIARGLQALAAKLDDSRVEREEKQTLIQEMQKQIEAQEKKEEQRENKDLLSAASSTLKTLEQETDGENPQQRENDGGGVQSNAAQEGQGEGKQSQAGGGDTKGDMTAQLSPEMKNGKSAEGDPQGKGQQKNPGDPKEQKGNQPDPNDSERTKAQQSAGKMKENSEGKSGRNKSDEIPQDGPPAERYYQPGEQGKEGLQGAKYVTVQLPEEVAADGNGVSTSSKEGKENRNRPKFPVSNVPLPAQVPDAPAEKQRMPLEYRDLIR